MDKNDIILFAILVGVAALAVYFMLSGVTPALNP